MGFHDVAFPLLSYTVNIALAYCLCFGRGAPNGISGCSIPTLLSYTVNIALAYCLCFGRGAPNGISWM